MIVVYFFGLFMGCKNYDSMDIGMSDLLANCVIVFLNKTWRLKNEIVPNYRITEFDLKKKIIKKPSNERFTWGRGIGGLCVFYDKDIVREFELLDDTIWFIAKYIM